ncbi:MAG: hypothetical protein HXY34_05025 [Candidatus Thorarchaeota archaeon]|nr:hypothetical protein [Candidatus Thorarchaeota archaeon]
MLALLIVLAAGWYLLPAGYNTLVLWLAPQLGNYVRPTFVMVNAMLVNPLNNPVMVAVWAGAGLVGGMMAGTKGGAVVVAIFTWLSCLLILAYCVIQLVIGGINLGTIPPIPPGESLTSVLGIPLVQSAITDLIPLIAGGGGGGMPDLQSIIMPFVIYLLVPVIVITVTAIIGSIIRPKEK